MAQLNDTQINGNLTVTGKASLASTADTTPTSNYDLTSKKYVDDQISELNSNLKNIGSRGDYRENNWLFSTWKFASNYLYLQAEKTFDSLKNVNDQLEAAALPFNAGLDGCIYFPIYGKVGNTRVDVSGYARFNGGQGDSQDKTGLWIWTSDYGSAVTLMIFGYIPLVV